MKIKLNQMQQSFKEYEESDEYKDDIAVNKFFENPAGAAWCVFIKGYEENEYRMSLISFQKTMVAFGLGLLIGILIG